MKKSIIILCLSVQSAVIFPQARTDTVNISVKDVSLDMLKSPTNPAFLLMNTSPAEIVEPGSSPEFYTSIQNASNNFSAVPNNYGFSVTPFWWTRNARNLSFQEDFETVNTFTFFRTTSISGGIVKGVAEDEKLWRYGIGFQTTLLRGKIDKIKKTSYLNELKKYHENYYGDINAYFKQYPKYVELDAERINVNLNMKRIDSLERAGILDPQLAKSKRAEEIKNLNIISRALDSLKSDLSEKFNEEHKFIESNGELDKKFNEMNERKGLKWDIGGGIAINSNQNKIDSTGIYRAGFWSNFGGNIIASDTGSLSDLSAFLLARYF